MKKIVSRLKEKYLKEIVPELSKEFGIGNKMAVPRLIKIVVNIGAGDIAKSSDLKEALSKDLATITGQKPIVRRAKVSIASFNLRRGLPVGLSVTLRGNRMYDFLDKLISIVLPRLRDFKGASLRSFDKYGNYTIGFSEHTVFPEIDMSKTSAPMGLEVTIVTNAKRPQEAKKLLELAGMPFAKPETARGELERKKS